MPFWASWDHSGLSWTDSHALANGFACTRARICMRWRTDSHALAHGLARTGARIRMHRRTDLQAQAYGFARAGARIRMRSRTDSRTAGEGVPNPPPRAPPPFQLSKRAHDYTTQSDGHLLASSLGERGRQAHPLALPFQHHRWQAPHAQSESSTRGAPFSTEAIGAAAKSYSAPQSHKTRAVAHKA